MTQVKRPSGMSTVTVFEIVAARAHDARAMSFERFAPLLRKGNGELAR